MGFAFLLILGLVGLAAAQSGAPETIPVSKKQTAQPKRVAPPPKTAPPPPPPPLLPKKITEVTKITPPKKEARKALIKAAKPVPDKKILEKIKAAKIAPKTPKGEAVLKNMLAMATSSKAPPAQKAMAAQQIKAIIAKPAPQKAAAIKALPAIAKQNIAKSVITAEKTTKPTPDQAAKALQLWTKNGGNQGTAANRSETVKRSQGLMGLAADGIIGPNTRSRASALGFPLALRSAQKPGAVGAWR
jgi:hypothetical protein